MSSLLQYIVVFFLVGLAIGYVGYKVYKRFFTKHKYSPCDDCDGCALKEGLREKNCPKDLLHTK
jgi:hypothetical protein